MYDKGKEIYTIVTAQKLVNVSPQRYVFSVTQLLITLFTVHCVSALKRER